VSFIDMSSTFELVRRKALYTLQGRSADKVNSGVMKQYGVGRSRWSYVVWDWSV